MASFLSNLAPLESGYYQGKDELLRRQMLEGQMRAQQQQQQGLAALANAYGNQQQMPPPSQPMAPPPGQQSQPMQPPQGMQLPPQGMPPGMMPGNQAGPPRQQMGPPPQQAPQAPQVKPYTAPQPPKMVTPQQQAPQAGGMIPAPPQVTAAVQSTLPDLETMASTLKKQGITGMALMAALQQHQQFLSVEGKQQLAQLNEQVRHMQAEAAMQRAGAAQTTAGTGMQREDRLERGAQGETAASAARIDKDKSSASLNSARAEQIHAKLAGGGGSSGKDGSGKGGLLDDDDAKFLAQQAAAGDRSAMQDLGYGKVGAANRAKVVHFKRMLVEGGGGDGNTMAATNAEYQGTKAGERTLGTRTANVGMAVNEADQFADLALKASDAVDRSQFPTLNKIIMAGDKGTGGEAVVRFTAAHNSLVNAYSRAVSPSGTPTVSDKEHAREILETAYSKGQYAAGIDQLRKEMAAAKTSPGAVRKEFKDAVTGGDKPKPTASDIAYAKAHPETKAQFKAHFGIDP